MLKTNYSLSQNKIKIVNGSVIKTYPNETEAKISIQGQQTAHTFLSENVLPIYLIKQKNSFESSTNFVTGKTLTKLSQWQITIIDNLLKSIPINITTTGTHTIFDRVDFYLANTTWENSVLSLPQAELKEKYYESKNYYSSKILKFSHGDLRPENIIWSSRKHPYIIDWDLSGFYPYTFDINTLKLRNFLNISEKKELDFDFLIKILQKDETDKYEVVNFLKLYITKVIIEKQFYFEKTSDFSILNGVDPLEKWLNIFLKI